MVTYRQIAKKEKIILVCYILGICYAKSKTSCPLVWAQAQQGEYCRCCQAAIEVLLRGLPPRRRDSFQEGASDAIMAPFLAN